MINIIKQEITFDETLEQGLKFICDFCITTPALINGYIHKAVKQDEKIK